MESSPENSEENTRVKRQVNGLPVVGATVMITFPDGKPWRRVTIEGYDDRNPPMARITFPDSTVEAESNIGIKTFGKLTENA